jgi:hypothetical protein
LLKKEEREEPESLTTNKWSLPAHLIPPLEPVKCDCVEHLDHIEVSQMIPCSAKEVYETLFGADSAVFWDPIDTSKGINSN